MTRALQYLRTCRVFCRHWAVAPLAVPEWTPEDAASLRNWLEKGPGLKLITLIRHQEQVQNASAVMKPGRDGYPCGFAAGFRACAAWVHTLSDILPPQEEEPIQLRPRGAADLIETYAP